MNGAADNGDGSLFEVQLGLPVGASLWRVGPDGVPKNRAGVLCLQLLPSQLCRLAWELAFCDNNLPHLRLLQVVRQLRERLDIVHSIDCHPHGVLLDLRDQRGLHLDGLMDVLLPDPPPHPRPSV